MGKRSKFKRRVRDFYQTPYEAVVPLLPHIVDAYFDEPCCGDGALIDHLSKNGIMCSSASDIEPGGGYTFKRDALDITECAGGIFITNPAWPAIGQHGDPVISLAIHLSDIAPTWLLLSADFAHNKYFSKVSGRCKKIVSVGRVKWIPGSPGPGKDNCAWYLFDGRNQGPTVFHGRTAQ